MSAAEFMLRNKKASFNYELMEKFPAGMELLGCEVRALRQKLGSLEGAHVTVRGGEAFLVGGFIPPYQPANTPKEYDPRRNRRLLLTKKEIAALAAAEGKKGLTIIPVSVYNSGRKMKVEIAIARGKKKFDKRETLKRRDAEREMERTLKNR